MLTSPRFDSAGQALLNVATIAVWLLAVVVLLRQRRARRVTGWEWLAVLVNVAIGGVYVPIGPLLLLASRLRRRELV